MKTATVEQAPQQWSQLLRWVASGEEVELTEQNKVVARLIPVKGGQPEFLARAKSVWGENPPGKTLSADVEEARGNTVF